MLESLVEAIARVAWGNGLDVRSDRDGTRPVNGGVSAYISERQLENGNYR